MGWRRHLPDCRNEEARLRGPGLLLCSGERGTNSALTELQDYFFLEAFFLPFFFALAMLALQY
jgi:hypothetical protein